MLYRRRALHGARGYRLAERTVDEEGCEPYELDSGLIEIPEGTIIEVIYHRWIAVSGWARVTLKAEEGVISSNGAALIRWRDWEPLEDPCGDPAASLDGPWEQRFTRHTTIGDALAWNPVNATDGGSGDTARLHRLLQHFDELVDWWARSSVLELLFCGHAIYTGDFRHPQPLGPGISVAMQGASETRLGLLYTWLSNHWQGGMLDARERGTVVLLPSALKASLVPGGGVAPAFILSYGDFCAKTAAQWGF